MPRRTLDPAYREEIRSAYFGARTVEERKRIVKQACKASGYSYGGMMRILDLKVRPRSLGADEQTRVAYMNSLGRQVWEYQQKFSTGTRQISTTLAIDALKEQGALPDSVGYFQISAAIRRQKLKNKSSSYFRRFERTAPLAMIQMDFTRSAYLEHIRKDGVSLLRVTKPKGANSKRERVWIAVAIDDSSRVAYARYYLANGESSRLAQHFLLKTCSAKSVLDKSTGEIKPVKLLQAQPKHLYTDRGSAFRNASFESGLRKLDIRHIFGSTSVDTEGNKQPGSNKQARGKVERMIRTIKDNFESKLFLNYREGTTFSLKDINQLFQKWLVRYNTSRHPVHKESSRWELFHPSIETAIYPPDESELLFSSSVVRKVSRRQVRVADGVYCKVPAEIGSGESIEIITAGANYYTLLKGMRVLLEVVTAKPAASEQTGSSSEERKEFDHDHLEKIALRSRLNREIETRTRQQQNIGSLTERFAEEIAEFLAERRSVKELKAFALHLLLISETSIELSIDQEGELVKSDSKKS